MKKITFFIGLFLISMLFVACSDRSVAENLPNLGSYTVGDSEVKIHKASLEFVKSFATDEENRATFVFETHSDSKNRKVSISVTYPHSTNSIDGEYIVNGSPRALDTWNTYYFETVGSQSVFYREATQGKCTITKHSENQYTVEFSFLPKGGSLVKGTFSGVVSL